MGDLRGLQKVGEDKGILYIESDEKLQKNFGVYLKKTFQNLYLASNNDEGYEKFQKYKPHVVIMELDLEGKDTIELIDEIQEIRSDAVIVSLSDKSDNYELLQTLDMGLAKMLLKPIGFNDLATVLIELLPEAVVKKAPIKQEKKTLPKVTVQASPVVVQKPKKVIEPKKEQSTVQKPKNNPIIQETKPQPEKPKEVKVEKKEPKTSENVQTVIKQKTPSELCFELIEKLMHSKALIEFFNSYKGVSVQNFGEIVDVQKDYFEIKVGISQIIAAKYEKFIILRTEDNKYIYAILEQINIKSASLKLTQPRLLDYKHRDKNYNRFKADRSCKASIYIQKKLVEFLVDYLSFKSAELITQNKDIKFNKGDSFDITLGFDLGGPSKMIKEKKFVKVFAKCEVIRMDVHAKYNKIIVLIKINKSGETSLLRYLKQREEEIMFEFKSIIHR